MHVMAGAAQGGAENIFLESVLALTDAPIDQFVVTRPNNQYRLDQFRAKNVALATASFNKWLRFSTRHVIDEAIRLTRGEDYYVQQRRRYVGERAFDDRPDPPLPWALRVQELDDELDPEGILI